MVVEQNGLVSHQDQFQHLPSRKHNDESMTPFGSLLLQPFFDIDPRPTFVVDTSVQDGVAIVYSNPSMRTDPYGNILSAASTTTNTDGTYTAFWTWVVGDCGSTGERNKRYDFLGMTWIKAQLEGRYNVIAAQETAPTPLDVSIPGGEVISSTPKFGTQITSSKAIPGVTDVLPPSAFLDFFANLDWDSSALGPTKHWSYDLKAAVRMLLNDPRPATLMWGPNVVTIWNEAYIPAVGLRHPSKYARPFVELFPEVSGFVEMVAGQSVSHESLHNDNTAFTLTRNGFYEEAYYSWNLIPIFNVHREHIGTYNPVFDSTRQQIVERRMTTLTRVSMSTAGSRSVEEFWTLAFEVLRSNEEDFPFLAIYAATIGEDSNSNYSSWSGPVNKTYKLVDTLNVPVGHPIAPPTVKLTEDLGLAQHFRAAAQQNTIVALHNHDGTLPEEMYQGLEVVAGEPCRSIGILPIQHMESEGVIGYLIAGINPRRPYDNDTAIFLQILSRMLGASMAAAVLVEEEIRRSKLAAQEAANEQQKLEAELQYQMKRAKSLNMRFTEFAA